MSSGAIMEWTNLMGRTLCTLLTKIIKLFTFNMNNGIVTSFSTLKLKNHLYFLWGRGSWMSKESIPSYTYNIHIAYLIRNCFLKSYHTVILPDWILKNEVTLILPSSIARNSLASNAKIVFEILWGILRGRTNNAWPYQPCLKNCQNGNF